MNDFNKVILSGVISKDYKITEKEFQVNGKNVIEVNFQLEILSEYNDNVKRDYVICCLYNDLANQFYSRIEEGDNIIIEGVIKGQKYTTEYGEVKLVFKVQVQKYFQKLDSNIL